MATAPRGYPRGVRGPPPGFRGPAAPTGAVPTGAASSVARPVAAPASFASWQLHGGQPYVLTTVDYDPNARTVDLYLDNGRVGRPLGDTERVPDPYVEASLGAQKFKTAHKRNTFSPVWKEKMTFRNVDPESTIQLDVLDHDTLGRDDWLGTGVIRIAELPPGRTVHQVQLSRAVPRRTQPGGLVHGNWPAPSYVPPPAAPIFTTRPPVTVIPYVPEPAPMPWGPPMTSPDVFEQEPFCQPMPVCAPPPPVCAPQPPVCAPQPHHFTYAAPGGYQGYQGGYQPAHQGGYDEWGGGYQQPHGVTFAAPPNTYGAPVW